MDEQVSRWQGRFAEAMALLDEESPGHDPARGIELLVAAAEGGLPAAQSELGARYLVGKGVEADLEAFLRWTARAAESDDPRAFYSLGLAYQFGFGVAEDEALESEMFERAVQLGHLKARLELGRCLVEGPTPDLERARGLLEPLADEGDAEAKFWLGRLFFERGGADLGRALGLFREASEGGFSWATGVVGACYEEGFGVAPDLAEARRWYEMAAAADNTRAMSALGTLLVQGRGGPRDVDRGLALLRQAARDELRTAQFNLALGLLHLNPTMSEVPLDPVEGMAWLRKAAEASDPGAQGTLGRLLLSGDFTPADPVAGRAWVRKAAASGDARSIELLARLGPDPA